MIISRIFRFVNYGLINGFLANFIETTNSKLQKDTHAIQRSTLVLAFRVSRSELLIAKIRFPILSLLAGVLI